MHLRLFIAAAVAAAALTATATAGSWQTTVASWYSAESTGSDIQGCAGAPRLTDSALSVATFLVPCGHRLVICNGSRCVVATRWDSGPYVAGRGIDLNIGTARALGFSGVGVVRWRLLP